MAWDVITFEECRESLKWMARLLGFRKESDFEGNKGNRDVEPYFSKISHLQRDFCRDCFKKVVNECNVFPTPKEFAEFFGIFDQNSVDQSHVYRVKMQIQRAAQSNSPLDDESKFVLDYIGKSLYDIKYSQDAMKSLTNKAVEVALTDRVKGIKLIEAPKPYNATDPFKKDENRRLDFKDRFESYTKNFVMKEKKG